MPTPRRKAARPPQRIWTGHERRTVVSQAAEARQRSSSKRGLRQAAERAKKETTRTIEAAQAKSQAGIGRAPLGGTGGGLGRGSAGPPWRPGRGLRAGGRSSFGASIYRPRMRPDRDNIAAPDLPAGLEW